MADETASIGRTVQQTMKYAMHSHQDKNARETQEDTLVAGALPLPGGGLIHLAAVFDGHGGGDVSAFLRDNLVRKLAASLAGRRERMSEAVSEALVAIDREIPAEMSMSCGSTGVVVLVDDQSRTITCANTGDSRAILVRKERSMSMCSDAQSSSSSSSSQEQGTRTRSRSRSRSDATFVYIDMVPLSEDHLPRREDERERIEAAGGRFIFNMGAERVGGGLMMTRAFGDSMFRSSGVIPDPETKTVAIEGDDDCIVVATDGLWDRIGNAEAASITRATLDRAADRGCTPNQGVRIASKVLAKVAKQRGSRDNITVVVIDLDNERKRRRTGLASEVQGENDLLLRPS